MNQLRMLLMIVAVVFTCFSCGKFLDKTDQRKIQLVNNSNQAVIFYMSNAYDSLWPVSIKNYYKVADQVKVIKPHSSLPYSTTIMWEDFIDFYSIKKMPFFVLSNDSVVKYPDGAIEPWPHTSNDVLKSWLLDIDSLQHYNWTLAYP